MLLVDWHSVKAGPLVFCCWNLVSGHSPCSSCVVGSNFAQPRFDAEIGVAAESALSGFVGLDSS